MTKAAFIKVHGALVPNETEAILLMQAWPDGKELMVSLHVPRNIRHHRLLFALLNEVIEGGAWDGDTDDLLDWCKYGTSYVRTAVGPDGQVHMVPKSINFESMPQDKFSRWFDRVIWLVCDRLLAGHDWEALRADIYIAIDGDLPERLRNAA